MLGFVDRNRSSGPDVRAVSQGAFQIERADFDAVVREAALWMRVRNADIPENALLGEPFSIAGGGASPAQAVVVTQEHGRLWAARLDYPDHEVARRTWVTELTIGEHSSGILFSARLLNVSYEDETPILPSRPRLIRNFLNRFSCHADDRRLVDTPLTVSAENLEDFENLLLNKDRRLPVLGVSVDEAGEATVDVRAVASRVSGLAHMFLMPPDISRTITDRFGKRSSAFKGAVRMYRRKFNPDQEVGAHPLWFARLNPDGNATLPWRLPVRAVFSESLQVFNERVVPRFDTARHAFAAQQQQQAKEQGNTEALLGLYEEEISKLAEEKATQKSEFDALLAVASEELKIVELAREDMRTEIANLNARIDFLQSTLATRGNGRQDEPLEDYQDIEEWTGRHLAGSVWVSPKAIRNTKKEGQFEDPGLFGEALLMIRDFYVPMRRNPSDELRQAYEAELDRLRLEESACFGNPDDLKSDPAYSVTYQGVKLWCDRHLKFGGGTDPRHFFRIYFCWLDTERIAIVGNMPTHLRNHLTN